MKRTRPQALPPNLPPRGLSRDEASEYLGVGVTLFDDLVSKGQLPEPVKVGARVIWDRLALDRAFEALPSRNTEDPEKAKLRKAIEDGKW